MTKKNFMKKKMVSKSKSDRYNFYLCETKIKRRKSRYELLKDSEKLQTVVGCSGD
jgi:hypothetical protein